MLRGTQVKRDGLVITVARRVIASGIALKFLSCPWLHKRSAKTTLEKRHRPQGLESQGNRDWRCLGVPTQVPVLITPEEPQVLITVEDQSISFGHWGNFLCAHHHNGAVWMSPALLFQSSFKLQLGPYYFLMSFWVFLTPFGKGYTEQSPGLCFHEYGTCSF